jgi:hypothetical protein
MWFIIVKNRVRLGIARIANRFGCDWTISSSDFRRLWFGLLHGPVNVRIENRR